VAIYRLLQRSVFGPEEIGFMTAAYEDALSVLGLSNRSDPITEIVAKKVIEIAQTGERDLLQIRAHLLKDYAIGGSMGSEPAKGLSGCRILVVEDEFFLADDLKVELEAHGAKVVGPVGDLGAGQDQVSRDDFDVAVVDIKLHDKFTWPLADELIQKKIPFGFVTGYEAGSIPERFRDIMRWEKPFQMSKLTEDIRLLCAVSKAQRNSAPTGAAISDHAKARERPSSFQQG
jgi:CheY-like chemotaxis protein